MESLKLLSECFIGLLNCFGMSCGYRKVSRLAATSIANLKLVLNKKKFLSFLWIAISMRLLTSITLNCTFSTSVTSFKLMPEKLPHDFILSNNGLTFHIDPETFSSIKLQFLHSRTRNWISKWKFNVDKNFQPRWYRGECIWKLFLSVAENSVPFEEKKLDLRDSNVSGKVLDRCR